MQERNTKQKRIVYEALTRLDHPTATELYEYIHCEYPRISRGTVFRILGNFAVAGKVRKVQLAGCDDRYDACLSPHYHARCRKCGSVFDVAVPEAEAALSCVTFRDFTVEGHEVEFYGTCRNCSK